MLIVGVINEQPEEFPINISEEMNKSGIWKHINDESQANLKALVPNGSENNNKYVYFIANIVFVPSLLISYTNESWQKRWNVYR